MISVSKNFYKIADHTRVEGSYIDKQNQERLYFFDSANLHYPYYNEASMEAKNQRYGMRCFAVHVMYN